MRYMALYDLMETSRNTNQWLGATAKAMAGHPMFYGIRNPALEWMGAWGEVTERSFSRIATKPDWNIIKEYFVHFDFDARVSVYASQGQAVNLVVVHATKGRATFCAKSHCPTVAGIKPRNKVVAC